MTQLPLSTTDLDAWRANIGAVADAVDIVRDYCGWHIAPSRTDTVTLNAGWADCTFILPSLKVTTVSSVTFGGVALGANYFEWSTSGILRLTSYYYRTPLITLRNVVVNMTHGYDELPGEVKRVALALADRGSSPSNIRQVGDIVLATSAADAPAGAVLTAAEKAVLNRYRLPVIA